MTNEQIVKLALAHGFSLKEQKDGTMALNKYVFSFVRAALEADAPSELTNQEILDCGPGQNDAVWSFEDQVYFARAVVEEAKRKTPTEQEPTMPSYIPKVTASEFRELVSNLSWQQERVSQMILKIPSSPKRNSLCDANIHLMAAVQCIKESQQNGPPAAPAANPA